MDTNNIPQLKEDFRTMLFGNMDNAIPRSKFMALLDKLINVSITAPYYSDVTTFEKLKAVKTNAYTDDVSGMPIQALAVGTIIKCPIGGFDLEYRLYSGEGREEYPFFVKPTDSDKMGREVHWVLNCKQFRYRIAISADQIKLLHTNPIIMLKNTLMLPIIIERAMISMIYNDKAYTEVDNPVFKLDAGSIGYTHDLDAEFMTEINNEYQPMTELKNLVIKEDVQLKLVGGQLATGNSSIYIDLFISLL